MNCSMHMPNEHAIIEPYHGACAFGQSQATKENMLEVDFLAYGMGPNRFPPFC